MEGVVGRRGGAGNGLRQTLWLACSQKKKEYIHTYIYIYILYIYIYIIRAPQELKPFVGVPVGRRPGLLITRITNNILAIFYPPLK